MALPEILVTELIEKETLTTEFVEKDLVNVTLNTAEGTLAQNLADITDVTITNVQDDEVLSYDSASGLWINKNIAEVGLTNLIFNEVPTLVIGSTYSVLNPYISGTLQVFLNGLKIYATQITYDQNNAKFTLDFVAEGGDLLECNYVKQ